MPKPSIDTQKLNLCVVTFPVSTTGIVPLSNLIDILYVLSNTLHIVTGSNSALLANDRKDIYFYAVNHKAGRNIFTRVLNYALTQVKIACRMLRLMRKIDLWVLFIGGELLILPMLIAKLSRKGIVLSLAGSSSKSIREVHKKRLWGAGAAIFSRLFSVLEKISYSLSTRLVVYSPHLVSFGKLEKYQGKISIAHEHFIDFNIFGSEKVLGEREDLVGYIGRLSGEKGVMNFVKAIPKVSEVREKTMFLVIGQGSLRAEIEELLNTHNLDDKVDLLDWVPHDELPKYLNQLKLLVLPSYTEGLPNIILEAMACGTPVLATPVGSIPDLIRDGETGFILRDNSPESIASSTLRVLQHPNLSEIAANASSLIEQNYTFEAAVEGYKNILDSLK